MLRLLSPFALNAALIIILLSGPARAEPPHYSPCQDNKTYVGADKRFVNDMTNGIPWPAWADLLNEHWTQEEIVQNRLFSVARIHDLIKNISALKPTEDEKWEYHWNGAPLYSSPATGDAKAPEIYAKAAQAFSEGKFADAIPLFDKVAADKNSPYRAAAAYSAARAVLDFGNFNDGIARIAKIAGDPTMREFQMAAYHLIGTRAYQTGEPLFVAAHYAELEHALTAPPALICPDALSNDVLAGAQMDIEWYLRTAFPDDFSANHTRRDILDKLAASDPFFDVVRAIAAPTPYNGDGGWLVVEKKFDPGAQDNWAERTFGLALKDSAAITAHAREQWLKTKNPLWGYALAQRTADIADVPLLKDMLENLQKLPKTPAISYALPHFERFYVRHSVRILLMNGKFDDALAMLQSDWHSDETWPVNDCFDFQFCRVSRTDNASAMLNGGIRLYLEKFDLPNARRWAKAASEILTHTPIDEKLRPLLASSYDELLGNHVPGDGRILFGLQPERHEGQLPLEVIGLLPRQKLLALADMSGVTPSEKRAFLASAWIRSYVLGDFGKVLDLLPRLREAFPELVTDIDNIQASWTDFTKRHLLTRLILRAPGFTLRPSWDRVGASGGRNNIPIGEFRNYGGINENIFGTDGGNASDGNWWCSLDVDIAKIDMADELFALPLGTRSSWYVDPLLLNGASFFDEWNERNDPAYHKQRLELANKIIAWHPLLKDADFGELEKLSKVENGPRLLSGQAIEWARGSNWLTRFAGFDKYLPETLHLAVRSTRYGCRRNGSHLAYSREAWKELHNLYPKSEWAMQTPYWFSGQLK